MDMTHKPPTPFQMFSGRAEEAMNFYVSLFPDAEVLQVKRYGKGEVGAEGSVARARFNINGQTFMCIDSPVKHNFTFTPAISIYVPCKTNDEIERLYAELKDGGVQHMPLGAYPHSKKFGWLDDRFGVSWQLDLLDE